MEDRELTERLDFLEYRQELLFSNTAVDRILFERRITRDQFRRIQDVMQSLRDAITNGQEVHSASYEQSVYDICPQVEGSYHFCEDLAQAFHEAGLWDEVFVALYGHAPKFQNYLNR